MAYTPIVRVALLAAVETGLFLLPELPGRMVARRLVDARRDGDTAAVIQAVRAASAPICQKLGFVELGGLEWYA